MTYCYNSIINFFIQKYNFKLKKKEEAIFKQTLMLQDIIDDYAQFVVAIQNK